jgi:hypothetical protein
MRGTQVESTSVGPIALAYISCDQCGKRWPDDQLSQTRYIVERQGIMRMGDVTEWDFCSESCLAAHFQDSKRA